MKWTAIIAGPAGRPLTGLPKRKKHNREATKFAGRDPLRADYCSLFTVYATRTIRPGEREIPIRLIPH
jgi:hypothetical protein